MILSSQRTGLQSGEHHFFEASQLKTQRSLQQRSNALSYGEGSKEIYVDDDDVNETQNLMPAALWNTDQSSTSLQLGEPCAAYPSTSPDISRNKENVFHHKVSTTRHPMEASNPTTSPHLSTTPLAVRDSHVFDTVQHKVEPFDVSHPRKRSPVSQPHCPSGHKRKLCELDALPSADNAETTKPYLNDSVHDPHEELTQSSSTGFRYVDEDALGALPTSSPSTSSTPCYSNAVSVNGNNPLLLGFLASHGAVHMDNRLSSDPPYETFSSDEPYDNDAPSHHVPNEDTQELPLLKSYDPSVNYFFECWLVSLSNDVLALQLKYLKKDNENLRLKIQGLEDKDKLGRLCDAAAYPSSDGCDACDVTLNDSQKVTCDEAGQHSSMNPLQPKTQLEPSTDCVRHEPSHPGVQQEKLCPDTLDGTATSSLCSQSRSTANGSTKEKSSTLPSSTPWITSLLGSVKDNLKNERTGLNTTDTTTTTAAQQTSELKELRNCTSVRKLDRRGTLTPEDKALNSPEKCTTRDSCIDTSCAPLVQDGHPKNTPEPAATLNAGERDTLRVTPHRDKESNDMVASPSQQQKKNELLSPALFPSGDPLHHVSNVSFGDASNATFPTQHYESSLLMDTISNPSPVLNSLLLRTCVRSLDHTSPVILKKHPLFHDTETFDLLGDLLPPTTLQDTDDYEDPLQRPDPACFPNDLHHDHAFLESDSRSQWGSSFWADLTALRVDTITSDDSRALLVSPLHSPTKSNREELEVDSNQSFFGLHAQIEPWCVDNTSSRGFHEESEATPSLDMTWNPCGRSDTCSFVEKTPPPAKTPANLEGPQGSPILFPLEWNMTNYETRQRRVGPSCFRRSKASSKTTSFIDRLMTSSSSLDGGLPCSAASLPRMVPILTPPTTMGSAVPCFVDLGKQGSSVCATHTGKDTFSGVQDPTVFHRHFDTKVPVCSSPSSFNEILASSFPNADVCVPSPNSSSSVSSLLHTSLSPLHFKTPDLSSSPGTTCAPALTLQSTRPSPSAEYAGPSPSSFTLSHSSSSTSSASGAPPHSSALVVLSRPPQCDVSIHKERVPDLSVAVEDDVKTFLPCTPATPCTPITEHSQSNVPTVGTKAEVPATGIPVFPEACDAATPVKHESSVCVSNLATDWPISVCHSYAPKDYVFPPNSQMAAGIPKSNAFHDQKALNYDTLSERLSLYPVSKPPITSFQDALSTVASSTIINAPKCL